MRFAVATLTIIINASAGIQSLSGQETRVHLRFATRTPTVGLRQVRDVMFNRSTAETNRDLYVLETDLLRVVRYSRLGTMTVVYSRANWSGILPAQMLQADPERIILLDTRISEGLVLRKSKKNLVDEGKILLRRSGTDICSLGRRMYLFSPDTGGVLTVLSDHGSVIREHEVGAEKSYNRFDAEVRGARVFCSRKSKVVVVVSDERRGVHAFTIDGKPKWSTTLRDFPERSVEHAGGRYRFVAPPQGFLMVISAFDVSSEIFAIQYTIEHSGGNARTSAIKVETRFLRASDGTEVGRHGVDPVRWTLHPLGEEESTCRSARHIHRSFASSWWSWSEREERRSL